MTDVVIKNLSKNIARTILTGFNRHFSIFSKITKGARERFENANWEAERVASRKRILFYDAQVKDATQFLEKQFDMSHFNGTASHPMTYSQKSLRLLFLPTIALARPF